MRLDGSMTDWVGEYHTNGSMSYEWVNVRLGGSVYSALGVG